MTLNKFLLSTTIVFLTITSVSAKTFFNYGKINVSKTNINESILTLTDKSGYKKKITLRVVGQGVDNQYLLCQKSENVWDECDKYELKGNILRWRQLSCFKGQGCWLYAFYTVDIRNGKTTEDIYMGESPLIKEFRKTKNGEFKEFYTDSPFND